jgi:hypothetical protein
VLKELFQFWFTPCAPEFRKLGYLKELIAIEARNRRVGARWHSHQENTHKIIKTVIQDRKAKDARAIVLGAGILLDVPLVELASHFKEVVLVDVLFARSTLKYVKQFSNVRCITHDINGIAESLSKLHIGCDLPIPEASLPFGVAEADFVFSINILSQLPVIPVQYATRTLDCSEKQLDKWSANIIRTHLEWLQSLKADVFLVSDVEHLAMNEAGDVEQVFDCLYGQKLPEPITEWGWLYAPYGELVKGYAMKANVQAVFIKNTSD